MFGDSEIEYMYAWSHGYETGLKGYARRHEYPLDDAALQEAYGTGYEMGRAMRLEGLKGIEGIKATT